MTFEQTSQEEAALNKAASFLVQALREVQQAGASENAALRRDVAEARAAIQALAARLDQQMAQEQEQRLLLANQLTGLATALDRLVSHLQGLSQLMMDMLERLSEPTPAPEAPAVEKPPVPAARPMFAAGGEGVTLTLVGVPGFQALMELQKALQALPQVAAASVERFQEGDSRLLVMLSSPASADDFAGGLHRATGQNVVVDESRPELFELRLRILS